MPYRTIIGDPPNDLLSRHSPEGGTIQIKLYNEESRLFYQSALLTISKFYIRLSRSGEVVLKTPLDSTVIGLIQSAHVAQFTLEDDDDFSLLPKTSLNLPLFEHTLGPAFIKPEAVGSENIRPTIPFQRRTGFWAGRGFGELSLSKNRDLYSRPNSWVAMVVFAHEASENSILPYHAGDNDPDRQAENIPDNFEAEVDFPSNLLGSATTFEPNLSIVFSETTRDASTYIDRHVTLDHVALHEILHTAGNSVSHDNSDSNIMHEEPSEFSHTPKLLPALILKLRNLGQW